MWFKHHNSQAVRSEATTPSTKCAIDAAIVAFLQRQSAAENTASCRYQPRGMEDHGPSNKANRHSNKSRVRSTAATWVKRMKLPYLLLYVCSFFSPTSPTMALPIMGDLAVKQGFWAKGWNREGPAGAWLPVPEMNLEAHTWARSTRAVIPGKAAKRGRLAGLHTRV